MSELPTSSGHRALPHTADVILQAWAPTRRGCLREAVLALADSFVDRTARAAAAPGVTRPVRFRIGPGENAEQLLALLGEALFAIDALGVVPADVELRRLPSGGLDGVFTAVPADAVEVVAAVPKAVAYSDLVFVRENGLWRCRFTVDV